jgi:flagellar hook-basal body complex protein FliE
MAPPAMPTELARAGSMLGKGNLAIPANGIGGIGNADAPSGVDQFAKLLVNQVTEVNAMQTGADDLVHQMLTGQNVNQAEVLTAVQKADLAFRMMLQVRNKLIEAYRELQQIQI